MQDNHDRAKRYRNQAKRLRVIASSTLQDRVRRSLFEVAQGMDDLADEIERRATAGQDLLETE